MPDIDPVSLNYFLTKKTKLTFPLDCQSFEEVKDKLSKKQVEKIMLDLGIYLAKLHQVKGKGFGLVEPRSLDKDLLIGSHETWYDFWIDNFKLGFSEMKKIEKKEVKEGKYFTKMQQDNRAKMKSVLSKQDFFLGVLKRYKKMLTDIQPTFLNGNIYTKNITIRKGKFVGLADFSKALIGDPVDELAYFSVMPEGGKYLDIVLKSWNKIIKIKDFEERMHLYRLIESYRKIFTRYIKHKYLNDYPEPLIIAAKELAYFQNK